MWWVGLGTPEQAMRYRYRVAASYPGILDPAFVLQATNAGVRRPGYEATG